MRASIRLDNESESWGMGVDDDRMKHLLALLDDPSERVGRAVTEALKGYGAELGAALEAAGATDAQRVQVARLVSAEEAPSAQMFEVGQLVRHKRYGYRGVVVSVDERCRASDDWYKSNRTQPDRDQPWYHVLADGSDQVFYPAQTSLEADDSDAAVENPYVTHFFDDFKDGTYVRNTRPFPAALPQDDGPDPRG